MQFLPMINMYSGDKTKNVSTMEFISKRVAKHKTSTIVTFDQYLLWKASGIVNDPEGSNPVRDAILLLESSHTLIDLLGAISTLMVVGGLKDILGPSLEEML